METGNEKWKVYEFDVPVVSHSTPCFAGPLVERFIDTRRNDQSRRVKHHRIFSLGSKINAQA
jgi:hypothetical protein